MTNVVIQPSFGNPAARRHWADTLDHEVRFSLERYRSALTDGQLRALSAKHIAGAAPFWGATAAHDARMATLAPGDVVLFTWQKMVRAIGEVGVSFRSRDFADRLWSPDPDRGSFHNVYSLIAFQQSTRIPYEEIWELPGFTAGDNFQGLRFLEPTRAQTILDGLRIETIANRVRAAEVEEKVAARLADKTTGVLPPEQMHTTRTSFERAAGTVLVNRAEALLRVRYQGTLPDSVAVGRSRLPVGVTDLHIEVDGHVEILEAKRGSEHAFVREALGQLLDYAAHSPTSPDRLSALFPSRPTRDDVALLHNYGIDVIHLDADQFIRDDASEDQRARCRVLWAGPLA